MNLQQRPFEPRAVLQDEAEMPQMQEGDEALEEGEARLPQVQERDGFGADRDLDRMNQNIELYAFRKSSVCLTGDNTKHRISIAYNVIRYVQFLFISSQTCEYGFGENTSYQRLPQFLIVDLRA